METSVCITVKNEQGSITQLLVSLLNQTRKPDEIVIVDGGSKDKTIEIINHFQKKSQKIRLLKEECTRGRGRNLGVEVAKNEIIAMTDAGCIAKRNWLENLTNRFESTGVEVAAGFYKMTSNNSMRNAMKVFLGVLPKKFDVNYMPSTRSVAFRKAIWEKVGGFPENIHIAEDTVFNYRLIKNKAKISRVKDAVVEWAMPESIEDFFKKIRNYAEGDAKTKICLFPGKGIMSHNLKAIFVLFRYILGFLLLFSGITYPLAFWILIMGLTAYLIFAFRKAGFWGIILQFVADVAVIIGFTHGIFANRLQRD